MSDKEGRLAREAKTIEAMIDIYCNGNHGKKEGRCPECEALLSYAKERLDKCPFQEDKPTCANCTVHCYQPEMREQTKVVMRYAGPRMMRHHPLMAMQHLRDGRKKGPTPPGESAD